MWNVVLQGPDAVQSAMTAGFDNSRPVMAIQMISQETARDRFNHDQVLAIAKRLMGPRPKRN